MMNNTIKLNNGVEMPRIGYGVYQIPVALTEKCVLGALSVGYRSIDTAQCYGNERAVGTAIRKSGLNRKDVFITTKLWGCTGFRDAELSINASLKRLQSEYIDLLLIHEPTGNVPEIYRAMEDAYRTGKLRAIGVANFIDDVYVRFIKEVDIVPAVNQVETHVFRQQTRLREMMKQYDTQAEAWSPLAAGRNGFFSNSILKELSDRYHKSIAQIGLRFLYQQGIIVIPKSVHIERMKENLEIMDFFLNDKDMELIKTLDNGRSLFGWW